MLRIIYHRAFLTVVVVAMGPGFAIWWGRRVGVGQAPVDIRGDLVAVGAEPAGRFIYRKPSVVVLEASHVEVDGKVAACEGVDGFFLFFFF